MKYVLLLVFLTSDIALARGNYSLFEVEKLEIKHAKLFEATRDPYAPHYTGDWHSKSELEWRVSLLQYIYLDNNMHMEMIDPVTVKTVGWRYEFGFRLFDNLSIFWGHHSRHILDEKGMELYMPEDNQFPVEDTIGIRIKIVEEKVGKGIFK
jgi:hypothetical protein